MRFCRAILVCAAGWSLTGSAGAQSDARFEFDRATLLARIQAAVGQSHPVRRGPDAECQEDRLLRTCRVDLPGRLSLQIVEGPDGSAPNDAQDFFAGARARVRSVKAAFDGTGQDQHAAFTGLCAGIVDAIRGAPAPGALQAYVEARETAYSLASEGGLAEIVLRRGRARLVVEAHRGLSLSCEVKAI